MSGLFARGMGIAFLSVFALAGCGGDSDDDKPLSSLRVVHASGNAPAVNVKVNGNVLSAANALAYGEATSRVSVVASTYDVSVDALLPNDGTLEVVAPVSLPLTVGQTVNVVALGNVGGAGELAFAPLVITTDNATVASDSVRLQVVHASAAAENALTDGVAVYVTTPGADLGAATPVASFELGEFTDPVTVGAGTYQIRITPVADSGTVVFDSGAVALPGGADLLVLAVDNDGPGAPVKLLVSTGDAASDFFINDKDDTAEVRVVHAASGVGEAEVFASSASLSLSSTELVDSILYAAQTDLTDITPASDYVLSVNTEGSGVGGAPIVASGVELKAGSYYSVLAAGDLPMTGTPNLFPLLAQDDRRSIATEARVRAIHAASTAGTVAVFVTPAGDVTVNSIELGEVTPTIAEFAVQEFTDYLSLAAGSYDVRVAVPTSGGYTVAIDETYALADGDVVTLVARNPDTSVAGFGFIVLSD